jgi:hypothetical protein
MLGAGMAWLGFALQTLAGALTYVLPVVFGRGAHGNRKLGGISELAWRLVEDADPSA